MDIVFDGPPSPDGAKFIEIEIGPRSVKVGEWVARPDGTHAIRFTPEALRSVADLTEAANNLASKKG